ncbi:fructose-1,6-bisphosphatase KNAG_0D04280 [Huiozyma naganishii CBS 8797]|uniref:Fructose-1,6-bisphosphatase n=1 Tax=Huiozyma naganishii (strain ATCC MYA-139 / BCRC 22969 / CBS 8797 / KCTC 17520 / NBRC 10181 / NCYC 3082 / Yp74L-3) TaxID=1071383 RepID=J7S629_HUIN7|nr:hypothetical protein KNAG_0D04280 [Kazachstania naganishii CBS 8797]CCK70174.1 hypothetical protein KNAG_0D04280 [Kazachstania naganishii CBS 8797]
MPIKQECQEPLADKIDTNIISLSRFIIEKQKQAKNATGDYSLVLNALGFAFKFIAHTVRRAELIHLTGLFGTSNATGDQQKKLDVLGDEIFINTMASSNIVKILVSEEQEELIRFETTEGTYAVCCDPIDGSSNIDAGVSVGTIVSLFKITSPPSEPGCEQDVLRSGHDMVAACYALYGASTHLLLTLGDGVNGFTLDTNLGEFILTEPDVRLPTDHPKKIYSVNEGNTCYWDESVKTFFDALKQPQDEDNEPYSARYVGSMVADMHRTVLYGGLYAYPGSSKSRNGKLRLLYEGFPMAFLIEQAGGKAVNDKGERILDLVPTKIHDKTSIWIGSSRDVDKYLKHIGKL